MSDLAVYRRHPRLEEQWSALAGSWRASLAPSERWYAGRLAEATGPVCELACGYGRLLRAAARAGRPVHGTDAVAERIEAARRLFAALGADAEFEVLPLPQLPQGRRFVDVVLACNSLGYVLAEDDKAELFARIRDALRPGGRLLFDHARGSALLRSVGIWPGLRGPLAPSGSRLLSALRWDRAQRCVVEHFVERGADGAVARSADRFLFTPVRRTLAMLSEAGFELVRVCGSFAGGPYRPWSRRLVAVARRR